MLLGNVRNTNNMMKRKVKEVGKARLLVFKENDMKIVNHIIN